MKTRPLLLAAATVALASAVSAQEAAPEDRTSVLIVAGAPGNEEYGAAFAKWAANWKNACAAGGARSTTIGLGAEETDSRERLRAALSVEPKRGDAELWLVLLGHGTSDVSGAKFNVRGDDVSAAELAEWLKRFERPVVVIAAFSASGAFLKPLSAAGRVVITATRSGSEENFARLGEYLSEAIADPAADLDKNGQTSLLEAWLTAGERVAAFYKSEERLSTEHALLDDNGDGLGTPADWFRGVRAVKRAKDGGEPDGRRAHQLHLIRAAEDHALPAAVRAERDALEMEVAKLRDAKATMPEEGYYRELEVLLLKLARLYESHAPPKPSRPASPQ
jgi:hypothetical protein